MKISLNKAQKEAVNYSGGPLLIIAGAGTGKTTVITEKVKLLIAKKNIKPEEILALTFSQKAAREMEERIDIALPLGYSQLWIATFHAFCERILRNEAIHIGLNPDFKLLTEAESVLFLKNNFFNLDLKYFRPAGNPNKFLKGILAHFSRLQDEDITPGQYLKFTGRQLKKAAGEAEKTEAEKNAELARLFKNHQQLKSEKGMMDFGDLISNTLKLFRTRKNIKENYKKKFKYLLVDEFQDTNVAQYELIKIIAPPDKRAPLTVSGDDSQSIYKFRGAAISNIINFINDYKQVKKIVLTDNYRSSQVILDHSHQLIKHNDPDTLETTMGISKKLISRTGGKEKPIGFIWEKRGENEAQAIAEKIKAKVKGKNGLEYRDFAILVRANNHADPFARELARQKIPYQFLGPSQLFRQPEVKNLIAYAKFLNNPLDDTALFKVLSGENIQISVRDLMFIRSFAKKNLLSLFEALEKIKKEKKEFKFLGKKTKRQIIKFVSLAHRHFNLIPHQTGGQILYFFIRDSGILKNLMAAKTEKEQRQAINISGFFDRIKSFENQNPDSSITHLDNWITLKMEMGESPLAAETDWSENNAVNILTVHSSKGLEFPVVFLVNLVNQRFPGRRRGDQLPIPKPLIKEILPQGDPHLQEERRLFYVGMTRAKKELFFSGAAFYGDGKLAKKPSPFVAEAIGQKTVEKIIQKEKGRKRQLSFLGWEEKQKITGEPANPSFINLSYSRLDAFNICPLQYKYKYIIRLPTPSSPGQALGNAVHKTLKQICQKQRTRKKILPLKKAFLLLEENWQSDGFSSKKHQKQAKKQAKKMIKNFYENDFKRKNIANVVGIEEPFCLKLGSGLKVTGRIDRIDNMAGDKIEIIDYKTGSRTNDQKAVDRNDQLTTYAMAASTPNALPFFRPVEKIVLSLFFLDSGLKISSSRTKEQVEKMRKKFKEIAQEIAKSDFPPQPARPFPCNYCEFKLLCEAWR